MSAQSDSSCLHVFSLLGWYDMAPYTSCAYVNCFARKKDNKNISFFSFPINDKQRAKRWQKKCGNVKIAVLLLDELKNKLICEKHFLPEQIKKSGQRNVLVKTADPIEYRKAGIPTKRPRLKRTAVPSQHLPGSSTGIPTKRPQLKRTAVPSQHLPGSSTGKKNFDADVCSEREEILDAPHGHDIAREQEVHLPSVNLPKKSANNDLFEFVDVKAENPEPEDADVDGIDIVAVSIFKRNEELYIIKISELQDKINELELKNAKMEETIRRQDTLLQTYKRKLDSKVTSCECQKAAHSENEICTK